MISHWHQTERILLRGGVLHAPSTPFATAMLIDGPTIAWLGDDAAADSYRDVADRVIDLDGHFVTPGFVDAHVHATSTGLALIGVDLTETTSLSEALDLVTKAAQRWKGAPIFGHGWDETSWREGRPPERTELDRASWGSAVFLSRRDVHSAVASSALLAECQGIEERSGYRPNGLLTQSAHAMARSAALGLISPEQRFAAQQAFRDHASAMGIVCAHEMGGPVISSLADLEQLIAHSHAHPGPLILGYWGELAQAGGITAAQSVGAFGVGGDLFVDGSIGSRTAHVCAAYADDPGNHGIGYLTSQQVQEHTTAVTHAGMQAGFHVIGDAGMSAVLAGFVRAATEVGQDRFRGAQHRLEHMEMVSAEDIRTVADLGVTASMQPVFDELWGNPGGMYEQRLGRQRAAALNPFAGLSSAGILLAFGSDSPVTPMNGWRAVRAAAQHHQSDHRLSVRAAFQAHTRGGWRATGDLNAGVLAPGAPAHIAVWSAPDLLVQAPDDRVSRWSTDPRSGTPGLPDLNAAEPTCVMTLVFGTPTFDAWGVM
jgi:predicted amidohydrolase YtcJ